MVTLESRGVKLRIDGFRPAEATFETVVWENLSIRRDFHRHASHRIPSDQPAVVGLFNHDGRRTDGGATTAQKPASKTRPKQSGMIRCAHVIGQGRLGQHWADRLDSIGIRHPSGGAGHPHADFVRDIGHWKAH